MAETNFIKSLNLFDSIAIVSGAMIGSGIFIVSSCIANDIKSPILLLAVWLIAGIMTLIGALSYGEFAASLPYAGGQYVYIRKLYGELSGFLYGWMLFFVIQTASIGAVALAFAKFAGILFPFISAKNHLINLFGVGLSSQQLLAIGLIIFLTYINCKGARLAASIQNIVTSTNIIALSGIIICGIFVSFKSNLLFENLFHTAIIPNLDMNILSAIAISTV